MKIINGYYDITLKHIILNLMTQKLKEADWIYESKKTYMFANTSVA